MRVLIVGGTGLLGQAVIDHLRRDGHEIVLTSRSPARGAPEPGIEPIVWDTRSPLAYDGPIDAVCHFAGANLFGRYWTRAYKQQVRDSRLVSTRRLVEWMAARSDKPSVFVCSNAVGYYGIQSPEPVGEDAPPGDDFLARLCVDWEREARKADAGGVRTVVLRSGILLGRGGGALGRLVPIFRFGLGGTIGRGRQPFPWVSLHDAARVVAHALEDDRMEGPYNMVAPADDTNATFTKALGRAMGRPTLFPVPAFMLRLLYGEGAKTLVEGQHVAPHRLGEVGFTWAHPDLDAALGALFPPR